MFGKWVTVNLGEGIKCEVFVDCVPSTPDDVLQSRARAILASRLTPVAADLRQPSECEHIFTGTTHCAGWCIRCGASR